MKLRSILRTLESADQKLMQWWAKKTDQTQVDYNLEGDVRLAAKVVRWLRVPLLILICMFLIGWVVYWLLFVGPMSTLTNPQLQNVIPALVPTPTQRVLVEPWDEHPWLSSEEAVFLRGQENVINFALLDDGGALYSSLVSISFSGQSPWEQVKPFSLSQLSVELTAVQMIFQGKDYHLNVWQPFSLFENQAVVYVVDLDGQIWQANLAELTVLSIQEVVDGLPATVNPNPSLNLTYRR